ncbi:hypothetical protein COO91_06796 [Nostoc flagelliforme CCNUN1]|uniref:Uncharacterized protein n=1 Tax=Nostoc flagelliforme CCNUN1 TaxID=2038116 RepID=A0A2K8SZA5_9NOSO|nr:hypothetical protein COO91_06796 [Nostoc flagelliforme CCNUN1]
MIIALAMPAADYAYANRCFCVPETFNATSPHIISCFCRN